MKFFIIEVIKLTSNIWSSVLSVGQPPVTVTDPLWIRVGPVKIQSEGSYL